MTFLCPSEAARRSCPPLAIFAHRRQPACQAHLVRRSLSASRSASACRATPDGASAEGLALLESEEELTSLTGEQLRALVTAKWGRPYDTRLRQSRDRKFGPAQRRMYLEVMWKFQGQKSFPISAAAYQEQLDAVAELLTQWGCVQEAVRGIREATGRPSVDTVGANSVTIPLSVELE